MSKKRGRRLVVDASVAFSAGDKKELSRACRDFLSAMFKCGSRIVLTPHISREWRRRSSPYSRIWLRRMIGKKDFCFLRDLATNYVPPTTVKKSVAKDIPLIDAAIATDRIVSSCDEEARSSFRRVAATIPEVANVTWINPTVATEDPIDWLVNGAKNEIHRRLGAVP